MAKIRMAYVQMEFNTEAYLGGEDLWGRGDWTLNIAFPIKCYKELKNFQKDIGKNYCNMLNDKLRQILNFCKDQKVDLVAFPEYSIPIHCLRVVKEFASENKEMTIVAGSHSVSFKEDKRQVYEEIGLKKLKESDKRKSICPVFNIYEEGKIINDYVEKLTQTDKEIRLKEGEYWTTMEIKRGDRVYRFIILLCSDFIADIHQHRNEILSGKISRSKVLGEQGSKEYDGRENVDFVIVISNTHKVQEYFLGKARRIAEKCNKPVLFVNNSQIEREKHGNSQIICYLGKGDAYKQSRFQEPYETYKASPDEECISIVDVNIDIQEGPGGVVPNDVYSVQKGVFPFIYREREQEGRRSEFKSYLDFYDEYFKEKDPEKREKILTEWKRDDGFRSITMVECLLGKKILYLINEDDSRYNDDFANSLIFHREEIKLDEWRLQIFIACKSFLSYLNNADLVNDNPPAKGDVERLLGRYRDEIPKLKEKVREEYVNIETDFESLDHFRLLSLTLPNLTLVKEASSGRVDTELAKWVLDTLKEVGTSDEDQNRRIENICNTVVAMRRYPSIKLVENIKNKLNDKESLKEYLGNYIKMKETSQEGIRNKTKMRIKRGDGIWVYGYSETVLEVFDSVLEEDRSKITVYVSECRNRLENEDGIAMASELEEKGFCITYTSDASIGYHLERVEEQSKEYKRKYKGKHKRRLHKINKVFMGCKIISPDGEVVNTIGSLMVAQLVHGHNSCNGDKIEVYIVGGSYKIWDKDSYEKEYRNIIEERRIPEAFMPHRPKKWEMINKKEDMWIRVENYVSDIVPAKFIHWIVTEKGIFEPQEIPDELKRGVVLF